MDSGTRDMEFWGKHLRAYVYVIQGDPETPIKVGIARDVQARRRELQCGNPQKLRLLAVIPGDRELETALHRRLKLHRVRGEWFAATPENVQYLMKFSEWMRRNARKGRFVPDWHGYLNATASKPPVVIRRVTPDPVMDPEEAKRERMMAAAGITGWPSNELRRLQREERDEAA